MNNRIAKSSFPSFLIRVHRLMEIEDWNLSTLAARVKVFYESANTVYLGNYTDVIHTYTSVRHLIISTLK